MWIVQRRHTRDKDGNTVAAELRDSDGFIRANVRWYGGIQIWIDTVTEEQNAINDTFRTYDIRGLIDKLQNLLSASEELFEHKGYWSNDLDAEQTLAYIPDPTSRGGATPPP
ncbi:hypothetical protein NZD89_18035 [Alicyclobacillus fastidiosus]|uniref:Uncharacterized protein n=1 Tax=Alicyclobacillus fastidiosus TaxID=392011 RepID=A0ABY6ZCJ9_9BACL|nr:hypothetical protein [Alicyclobacillus fastidiosus]WAH40263.1 hypothetical protein NZD89_18035 [Alicyclobacillus fastidiosus]GMA61631.1 hypothetical protein GCM10025859_20710 [Alicyclobacillus fastidiosus]